MSGWGRLLLLLLVGGVAGVNKCCPLGEHLDLHTKECREGGGVKKGFNVSILTVITGKVKMDIVKLGSTYSQLPERDWEGCDIAHSYIITRNVTKFTLLSGQLIPDGLNGTFYLRDGVNKKNFPETAYCLDTAHDFKTGTVEAVAKLCQPCREEGSSCYNFCQQQCSPRKVRGSCVTAQEELALMGEPYTRLTVPLHCSSSFQYHSHLVNLTTMEVDGKRRHFSEYCIQIEPNMNHSVLFCDRENIGRLNVVKIVLLILSIVSLLTLILLHTLIPDLWKHHFTKLKVPFYFSTLMSFLFLVISQFEITEENRGFCIFLGLMIQYWSLAMFCWLTVMSKNIWATFSTLSNPLQFPQARQARQVRERAWAWSLCFGVPGAMVLGTSLVQVLGQEDWSLHPGLDRSCFLAQYWPQLLYFHLPLLSLLATNIFLYSILVFKFSCGMWSSQPQEDEWISINWRNLRVVLELFVFMGVYWLAEVS